MVPIEKEKCTSVGFIQKPHGLKGEVIVIPEEQWVEVFDSIEECFIEIEGGLVPFFISEEGVKYRNNESIIIKFDYIGNEEKAKEISGCLLYVSNEVLLNSEYPEVYKSFVGMKVIDEKYGELGIINALDDFSGNIVITIDHSKGEILIPLSEEIIQRIDERQNNLYLDCPEGLIDIYLG